MRSLVIFFFVFGAFSGLNAQEGLAKGVEAKVDTFSIISGYLQKLQKLVEKRDSVGPIASYPAPNAYYYQAVLWARENGITDGRTPTTFCPNDACTRGPVVTFLYSANH